MQVAKYIEFFDIGSPPIAARPVSGGRVNDTYVLDLQNGTSVVLQRVNTAVPVNPEYTMFNIEMAMAYLKSRPGPLRFPRFYAAKSGGYLYRDANGDYWRAYEYIEGESPRPGQPQSPAQLGGALGAFHRSLAGFPVEELYVPTPHYHNTPRIFEAFLQALSGAPQQRSEAAASEIEILLRQRSSCSALLDKGAAGRVTHNDAKLENLIVDPSNGQPLCFVDYDQLMPGIWAFDFGNAARSCCKDCETDVRDMSLVSFKIDYFDTFAGAYLARTRDVIEGTEAVSLVMGAVVMSLELGLRYMTEYLSGNNVYFQTSYPQQNLDRARVQLLLCLQMQKQYPRMVEIVKNHLGA